VFTYSAYVTSNSYLSSNPEAWKPEGQRVGYLQWVALTQVISHAVILRVCYGGGVQLEIGGKQGCKKSLPITWQRRPLRLGLKNSVEDMGTLIQGPTLSHLPPSPNCLANMFDDFTLKVSFLAAFLIVVSLFVSGYFSLRGDPMVKSFPSYLRLT
jgi:hypothetical protein